MPSPYQRKAAYLQTISRHRHPVLIALALVCLSMLYLVYLYRTFVLLVVVIVLSIKLYRRRI
jgi:hypothetical protein